MLGAAANEALFLDVKSIRPGDLWKLAIEGFGRGLCAHFVLVLQ